MPITLSPWKKLRQRWEGAAIEYSTALYQPMLARTKSLWAKYRALPDEDLAQVVAQWQQQVRRQGKSPEHLPEVFALAAEAIRRTLGMEIFDEQLTGAMVLDQGRVAEMQTGEGKTLTAVLPAAFAAMEGRGVHVLTFNDYLARRDATWMGPVYRLLGLTVGFIQEGMSIAERQAAYGADITYATAKEAGFDYLRDSLCLNRQDRVHRDFHFAIVDEADSILIDEARVPLIIAAAAGDAAAGAGTMAELVRELEPGRDFGFDQYRRGAHLTEAGLRKAEARLGCANLYDEANLDLLARLHCALQAAHLLERDKDYIIRQGRIELVDEFTGRVADRRRWPDGLQAALEAKEGLAPQSQGRILNTITLQHFLRLYPKLAGMTATAVPAEGELREFYQLRIVVIPPHQPCIRRDARDRIFATRRAKDAALAARIAAEHASGRPVLVGTGSVAESDSLAAALAKQGVACQVLNARDDAREAELVATAGRLGAVTVSTNMAGRGTDIRLGGNSGGEKERILALGGLLVLAAQRHASARIDNQLRGRSGRQGDPGESQFYVSLEDDLPVKYRFRELLPLKYTVDQDGCIPDPVVNRRLDQLQRIVEGQDLEIKKTICKYSGLLEQQRRLLFQRREQWLISDACLGLFRERAPQALAALEAAAGPEAVLEAGRRISLLCLDQAWSRHLAAIADIREGIHMARLGGQDPLLEFHRQAIASFEELEGGLEDQALEAFSRLRIVEGRIIWDEAGLKAPSSTWTYLVNDNPFENMLAANIASSLPLSIAAGVWWPLLMVVSFFKKFMEERKRGRS